MVPIGAMRHRLEFLDLVRTDDGEGGFTTEPAVQLSCFAAIRPASTREIDAAGRLQQRLTHVAHVRWRPDFEPRRGQAVRWQDRRGTARVAYVNGALDAGDLGRFMQLDLREGGPTGGVA